MQDWYTADTTWSLFSTTQTREDYVQHMVIPGRFHAQVPPDVTASYVTVEYLMAHAWYHYPMYDEALKKLLGIFEMAIKLRCDQLGISITYAVTNDSGKTIHRSKTLANLLKEYEQKEPAKQLKGWLNHTRELRNIFSHPRQHSFAGGTFRQHIIVGVNLLNLIFEDPSVATTAQHLQQQFEQNNGDLQDGLFILEHTGERFLVTGMQLTSVFPTPSGWVYYCAFKPVLREVFQSLSNHRYPPPLIVALQHPVRAGDTLEGTDLKTQTAVRVGPNNHPDNVQALQQHQLEWAQLDELDQSSYELALQFKANRQLQEDMFRHRWGA
jgi:hypothetical protein